MDTARTITGFQNTGWTPGLLRAPGERTAPSPKPEAAATLAKSAYAAPWDTSSPKSTARETTTSANDSSRRMLDSRRELDRKLLAMEEKRRAAQEKLQQTLQHTWPLGGPLANENEPLAFGPSKAINVLTRSYDRQGNAIQEEGGTVELFNSPMFDWIA